MTEINEIWYEHYAIGEYSVISNTNMVTVSFWSENNTSASSCRVLKFCMVKNLLRHKQLLLSVKLFSWTSSLCKPVVLNLLTSVDPHWITTGSRRPLSHFYDLNLKTEHKKYTNSTQQTNTEITKYFISFTNKKIHTNWNFNFNGKVNQT
jgi:hypothetical protein